MGRGRGFDQQQLLALALATVVGVVLGIIACSVPGSDKPLLPLVVLLMYIFTPLPIFLCGRQSDDGERNAFGPFAHFIVGIVGVSGPCLAIVLAHTGEIGAVACFLILLSGAVLIGAAVWASEVRAKQDSW
eukprot:Hpha_TRINITY_DN24568_c0_g1::TRINITY_DN24568_c0_g1_i1::g.172648::m.172648